MTDNKLMNQISKNTNNLNFGLITGDVDLLEKALEVFINELLVEIHEKNVW
jgi:hypothetical protein